MSEAKPDPRLARVVAMANWKGGVGKTTLAKELAARLVAVDSRVLLVDLDLSGNLAVDLGLSKHPELDDGLGIVQAITHGAPLRPIRGARPGLDWIPGGMALRDLTRLDEQSVSEAFRGQLARVATPYDLVILDLPPSNPEMVAMALSAARYVLVPTKTDPASWDGIRRLGPFVKRARDLNPELAWLGMVLFDVDTRATTVLTSTRAQLQQYGIPLFETVIRHSARAAHYTRMRGQLQAEFVEGERVAAAAATTRAIIEALRLHKNDNTVEIPSRPNVGPAESLQEDYARLADEVIDRIAHIETGGVR